MSAMVKTALRRELKANAVNDEKFEILKDAAKTGDFSRIIDAFFVLKPRIAYKRLMKVPLTRIRLYSFWIDQ
jgi:hypothetical protein